MFYNDRLSGKERKQKIALIVCAVVVLAVWLMLTIRINTIFPSKKIEKCGYGEWINYTPDIADIITVDVSISPVSSKMYDRAGILKDYTKEQLGIFSEGKDDADYLVFTVDIKNNGQEAVNINRLASLLIYCTEFNGDSNSLERMNTDIKTVASGETQRVQFVTNIKYKDAAGMWHEDRFRPLVTALANLIMNLLMVQFWGIYGVIISTVISTLFIGMPWLLHNLFTVIFTKDQMMQYVKKLLLYVAVTAVAAVVTYGLCSLVNAGAVMQIIIKGVICLIVPNVIYLAVYYRTYEFKQTAALADKMLKGKVTFLKKLM